MLPVFGSERQLLVGAGFGVLGAGLTGERSGIESSGTLVGAEGMPTILSWIGRFASAAGPKKERNVWAGGEGGS